MKICPLLASESDENCRKEKCAWWTEDELKGCCAIKYIALAAGFVADKGGD